MLEALGRSFAWRPQPLPSQVAKRAWRPELRSLASRNQAEPDILQVTIQCHGLTTEQYERGLEVRLLEQLERV